MGNTREKAAHHMWEAEKEDGKLRIKRTKYADEEESLEERKARRAASRHAAREESAMGCLGIWAASLVDDPLFSREIAQPIAKRFNAVRSDDAPKVHTWDELRGAVGEEKLAKVRNAISDGMRTRIVSKSLNVPFLVAAEIIDRMDGLDMDLVKRAVKAYKAGDKTASRKYGSVARDIQAAFARFGGMKLAVDDKARKYFEDYFGPYGQELVADIQRRVRADLALRWLKKNGVDEAAAEYWSTYFSENDYGAALVSEIPKKLSPAK